MLEEFKKLFGMDYKGPAPVAPVPQQVASQMGDIPQQSLTPEANTFEAPVKAPYWRTPSETYEGFDGLTVPQGIGRAMGGVADLASDFVTEVAAPGVNTGVQLVSDAGEAVGTSILSGISGIKGGFNTSDIPKPEIVNTPDIKDVVKKQPSITNILDTAAAIDPSVVEGLTPEDNAEVKKSGDIAGELLLNDKETDPKTVMESAGGFLGDLFKDKAIQQALIYYTGARLMGYSGSGSGMAAGQILQKGWASQAKDATKQAEIERADALADLKARTPDRSKTVQMFDVEKNKIIEVNMAPNGDAYPPGSEEGFNAASAGLVTYRPNTHKTFNEMDQEMVTYTNKSMTDTLSSLTDEDMYPNADNARALFDDGLAVSQLVQHATRRLKESGVDYNTPAFRNALSNTVKSEVLKIAKGGDSVDSDTMTKDLIGSVESNWLKASLEGSVPKFVLGKYTSWNEGGKGVTYDSDFELPREDETRLFDTASGINQQFITHYTEKNPKKRANILKAITQTNTIKNLSKVFTNGVMSDKKASAHWQQVADKSNPPTNAFNAWLQSDGASSSVHPLEYKGLNNTSVKDKVESMYESQLKD